MDFRFCVLFGREHQLTKEEQDWFYLSMDVDLPALLHRGVFQPCVELLGSEEQRKKWIPLCESVRPCLSLWDSPACFVSHWWMYWRSDWGWGVFGGSLPSWVRMHRRSWDMGPMSEDWRLRPPIFLTLTRLTFTPPPLPQ